MSTPTLDELAQRVAALDGIGSSIPSRSAVPTIYSDLNGLHTTISQLTLTIQAQLNTTINALSSLQSVVDELLVGEGAGEVVSVFGRTGTVVAQADDYTYSQIGNTPQLPLNTTAVSNKVLTAYNSTTGAFTQNQLSASNLSEGTTGSGSIVLATSPALITPALGTPSSGNLENCTLPSDIVRTDEANTFTQVQTFDANLSITQGLLDATGSSGTSGQVLSSTATGTEWVAPSSTNPGGASGELQGNNSGAFAGLPGSVMDFTNGGLLIAPTGVAPALELKGDGASSDILQVITNGNDFVLQIGGAGNVAIDFPVSIGPNASQGVALTLTGDAMGSDIQDLYASGATSNIGNNANNNLNVLAVNAYGNVTIDPATGGPSPALTINGDGTNSVLTINVAGQPSPCGVTSNGRFYLQGPLQDVNSSLGSSGQVLSSTGAAVQWVNAGSGSGEWQKDSTTFSPGTFIDLVDSYPLYVGNSSGAQSLILNNAESIFLNGISGSTPDTNWQIAMDDGTGTNSSGNDVCVYGSGSPGNRYFKVIDHDGPTVQFSVETYTGNTLINGHLTSNSIDTCGILSFAAATTATVTFAGSAWNGSGEAQGFVSTVAPIVVVTPTSDIGSGNRYWVTYTGSANNWTAFTLNFSSAYTGTVNYIIIGEGPAHA